MREREVPFEDMRCPHCAGEIQDGSLFCGICGKSTVVTQQPVSVLAGVTTRAGRSSGVRPVDGSSPSLFELPVSKGARAARIAIVLALDALLLIAGIAMIVSYLNDRDRSGAKMTAPVDDVVVDDGAGSVKFAEPVPLHRKHTTLGVKPQKRADRKARSNKRAGKKRRRGKRKRVVRNGPRTGSGAKDEAAGATTVLGTVDAGVAGLSLDAAVATAPADAGTSIDPDAPSDAEVAILARQIRLVVNREVRLLRRCYARVAKVTTVDKATRGRVEIRFEVMPDGKTRNVGPRGNTTGSKQLALCVANLIRHWKFPSHSGKRSIPFVWPFNFGGS